MAISELKRLVSELESRAESVNTWERDWSANWRVPDEAYRKALFLDVDYPTLGPLDELTVDAEAALQVCFRARQVVRVGDAILGKQAVDESFLIPVVTKPDQYKNFAQLGLRGAQSHVGEMTGLVYTRIAERAQPYYVRASETLGRERIITLRNGLALIATDIKEEVLPAIGVKVHFHEELKQNYEE